MVERVIATPATLALIEQLKAEHGPDLMFHQSGGCCDNSAANCYLPTDLTIGPTTCTWARSAVVPVLHQRVAIEYWKHTQLIIDVVDGNGGTFSLEGGTGKAFHTRSRLYDDAEMAAVEAEDRALGR